MRRLLALLLSGLFLASLVAAQNGGAFASEPTRRAQIRFYIFGGGDFEDLYLRDQRGDPQLARMAPGRRSAAHAYAGPSRFELWRQEPLVGKGAGRPAYRSVAQVSLPPGDELLVLVLRNPAHGSSGQEPEFHLFAMEDSADAVPIDHLVFFNLTGAPLQGVVGREAIRLGAGASEPVDLRPYLGERDVLVGLTVRYRDADRVVMESRMRFLPERRTIFVLLPPERAGSLAIRAFRILERVEPATERSDAGGDGIQ